jgi:transcriptional regulator with XRE-family HTH domain
MRIAAINRIKSTVGARIRSARLSMGLSQEKLGVLIGLDEESAKTRISRYESGIHEPAIETSYLIAKALDVPLAFLYCENDLLANLIVELSKLSPAELQKIKKMF